MHVTLMHKPTAGTGDVSAKKLVKALGEADFDCSYQSMDDEHWLEALDNPGDLVVVAGGDGTVAKIALQLLKSGVRVPTAILPMGTANNIAGALGVDDDLPRVIRGLRDAKKVAMDVGVASGPWNNIHFLESAGIGLFAQMMAVINALDKSESFADEATRLAHHRQLYRTLLKECRPQPWRVWLDGHDHTGEYLFVEVMNLPTIGPKLTLAPDADFADGGYDVVFASGNERTLLSDFLDRPPEDDTAIELTVRRARVVEIEWDGSHIHLDSQLYADGNQLLKSVQIPEYPYENRIRLELKPKAISFLVPAATRS